MQEFYLQNLQLPYVQAAEAGASNIMSMVLGGLALDLRLHSQAEMQVLYPLLAQRLGSEGAALAQRSLAVSWRCHDCCQVLSQFSMFSLVLLASQTGCAWCITVQEHAMVEQSIADMLVLRNHPEALVTRVKQAQTEASSKKPLSRYRFSIACKIQETHPAASID